MNEQVKFRHEFKYLCDTLQLTIIRHRLQSIMQYDTHVENGQYTIRSMYFDDLGNSCYYENESGTDPREKFRIRIYNASDSRITLECKRKERSKTLKTACALSKNDYERIIQGGELKDITDKPELYRKFMLLLQTQRFKPVVIVEYDRTPFVCRMGNVRITLDMNIRSSNVFSCFFCKDIPTRQILPRGQHLLEVKYDEFLPEYISEALQLGNLQQSAFSKYYLCRKYSMGEEL